MKLIFKFWSLNEAYPNFGLNRTLWNYKKKEKKKRDLLETFWSFERLRVFQQQKKNEGLNGTYL